jgi:hypothetical protein
MYNRAVALVDVACAILNVLVQSHAAPQVNHSVFQLQDFSIASHKNVRSFARNDDAVTSAKQQIRGKPQA